MDGMEHLNGGVFWGRQGPERAVAPWMEWNSKALLSWKKLRPGQWNVLYGHSSGKLESIPLTQLDPNNSVYGTPQSLVFNHLKPTGYEMQQQVQHSTTVRSAHTVFMCFVFI